VTTAGLKPSCSEVGYPYVNVEATRRCLPTTHLCKKVLNHFPVQPLRRTQTLPHTAVKPHIRQLVPEKVFQLFRGRRHQRLLLYCCCCCPWRPWRAEAGGRAGAPWGRGPGHATPTRRRGWRWPGPSCSMAARRGQGT
jgi:hypothetical protein